MQPQPKPAYRITTPSDDDWDFIFGTWRSSLYHGELQRYATPRFRWNYAQQVWMERHKECDLFRVAADSDDRDYLIGWACLGAPEKESPTIHYVYVRDNYRRHGVATALVGAGRPVYATYWTKDAEKIAMAKLGRVVYTPSLRGRE